MASLLQLFSTLQDLVDPGLVGVQFLLKVLVLLHFSVQVGWIEVAVVSCHLDLLVDPSLGLVTVSLKLLELVGILQHCATNSRLLHEKSPPLQKKSTALGDIFSSIMLTLDQLGGKLIQGLDLLLLGGK